MQKRNFQQDTYYHIYNRGNTKERLFFCERDFLRFANTVTRYLQEYKSIQIHVWCILPNHFHFLLSSNSTTTATKQSSNSGEAQEISRFMQKVQQAYARYLAVKYADQITLGIKAPYFEGRFKAKQITDESYLARVAYYVRHNAVKHDIVENSHEWPWAGVSASEGFPAMQYTGVDPEFDPGFD